MKSKSIIFTMLFTALSFSLSGTMLAKNKFLTLTTGNPGGVYYSLGGGMAVVIQKSLDGVRYAADP